MNTRSAASSRSITPDASSQPHGPPLALAVVEREADQGDTVEEEVDADDRGQSHRSGQGIGRAEIHADYQGDDG